jgi:hypothetical protein
MSEEKKKVDGLRTAVKQGEISAKDALEKIEKAGFVRPSTRAWFKKRIK